MNLKTTDNNGIIKEQNWGFINEKGEYTINPQFKLEMPFSNSLAAVYNGKQFGFINEKGEYTINPQFDDAGVFVGDYAPVKNGKQWGYIDTKGKYSINAQFDMALNFTEKLAAVKSNEKWGYINYEGKYIINTQFDDASSFIGDIAIVKSSDKYGLIDKDGKYKVNPQFDYFDITGAEMLSVYGEGYTDETVKTDKTPPLEKIAEDFLNHINKREYAEAKKLASPESTASIDMLESFSKMSGEQTKISKVENIKCTQNKEIASCNYQENGEDKKLDLVKRNGKWLVDMKKETPNAVNAAEASTDTKSEMVVNTNYVNMRYSPSTNSDVITLLNEGDVCQYIQEGQTETVAGRTNKWYKVQYRGSEGWVFGSFLNFR